MQSGLAVDDDVRDVFNALRMKRKHRYVIYKLGENKDSVVVDKIGDRNATFEEFKEAMPQNNSR